MGTNKNDDVRELLNRVHTFLSNLCRDARCDDHCSECIGASDLADDVYDLLRSPRRNCDVGTVEEQSERFRNFCKIESSASGGHCTGCRAICYGKNKCELAWAQMPYAAERKGET